MSTPDLSALNERSYEVGSLVRMAINASRTIAHNSDAEQAILQEAADIAATLEVALKGLDELHDFIEKHSMAAEREAKQ